MQRAVTDVTVNVLLAVDLKADRPAMYFTAQVLFPEQRPGACIKRLEITLPSRQQRADPWRVVRSRWYWTSCISNFPLLVAGRRGIDGYNSPPPRWLRYYISIGPWR